MSFLPVVLNCFELPRLVLKAGDCLWNGIVAFELLALWSTFASKRGFLGYVYYGVAHTFSLS